MQTDTTLTDTTLNHKVTAVRKDDGKLNHIKCDTCESTYLSFKQFLKVHPNFDLFSIKTVSRKS